jgi:hypothetical protein
MDAPSIDTRAMIDKARPKIIPSYDEHRFNLKRNEDGTYTQTNPPAWGSWTDSNGNLYMVSMGMGKGKTAGGREVDLMKIQKIEVYHATGAESHYAWG